MALPTLFIVDGSGYLFRAFHAMPYLSASNGEPTAAVYGMANMLRHLLSTYQPEYMAVVFDAESDNFRHQLYPLYKATRPPKPSDLAVQEEVIHTLVEALGIPHLIINGVEADDVIATLTRQALQQGFEVKIFTSDKDFAQLVQADVTLYNTMNHTCLDEAGVFAKFAVTPAQIVDYLALMGDNIDNVPGVNKVGPKTAAKWLAQYGTLENLCAHAHEIKGAVGENLRAALDKLPLSKALVTLKNDVLLPLGIHDLKRLSPNKTQLRQLYTRLNFKTWLTELNQDSKGDDTVVSSDTPAAGDYYSIVTVAELDQWLQRLRAAALFAFDTESTSVDYRQAEIVGVSFCCESGQAAYVPMAHTALAAPQQLARETVLAALKPLLEDDSILKIGQNIKYDAHLLRHYGIELRGMAFDTMLESYVLDSTASRHNMDDLARHYLGYHTTTYADVTGTGKKQLPFAQVPLQQATAYAAEDADITLRLHQYLWPRLQAQPRLQHIFVDMEMPLLPVLLEMEQHGVKIDADLLHAHSHELAHKLYELEQQAYEVAGQRFNLASPKQLQDILFDKLAIPVKSKTPKGQASTAEAVLQELAEEYELPRLIMEHRSLSKLKSTYTDRLPQQIDPHSGRVHTSYHQAVAQTGRLSSAEPNLQNIPIRTAEGRRIRQAFIAAPGYVLLAADYSQIELRIMAHLSADTALLSAFTAGEDIHRHTAAEVFNTPLAQVTPEQRRSAKAINFGLIYGMSAFGLAKQLNISRNLAQEYIDHYFARYPKVKTYMEYTRQCAIEQGYVETVFGRRLYVPDINSRNNQRRQYAERTAINAPMQGSAADIIKYAMITIQRWIHTSGLDVKMLMQVHDELVFEIASSDLESAHHTILTQMRTAATLSIPLEVESGIGANWNEAHS
jgi:DNA polymerase I